MKKHLSEVELIELCQGRLNSRHADEVRKHLAKCAYCAHRMAATDEFVASMDAWKVAASDECALDAAGLISQAARDRERDLPYRIVRVTLGQAAAIIVLAGLSGAVAGHYLAQFSNARRIPAERVSEQVAAHMMHLDALAPGAMTGLDITSDEVQIFLGGVTQQ